MSTKGGPSPRQAKKILAGSFHGSGYVRTVNARLRKKLGQKYKKGYEVRLTARTKTELARLRRMIRTVGFRPGKPYENGSRFVQPIYGKAALDWFQALRKPK